jgi:hypothetical protein
MFHVGPSAPLPTRLGTLRASAVALSALEVTANASCSAKVDAAQAALDLEIAGDAAPWRDVLQFETWVDGIRWSPQHSSVETLAPGTSWRGRGVDVVYRICRVSEADRQNVYNDGLAAGTHVVEMRARLPGTTMELRSDTVTVELACPDESPSVCPTTAGRCDDVQRGCSAGDSRGAPWLVVIIGLGATIASRRRRAHG